MLKLTMFKRLRYGALVLLLFGFYAVQSQSFVRPKTRGWIFQTDLGFVTGVGKFEVEKNREINNRASVFQLHQTMAYLFNPYVYLGGGLGFDFWGRYGGFIPLYFTVNMALPRKVAPSLHVSGGYAFKWYGSKEPNSEEKEIVIHGSKSGIYFETGFGLNATLGKRCVLSAKVVYKLQESRVLYNQKENQEMPTPDSFTNSFENVVYMFVGAQFGIRF